MGRAPQKLCVWFFFFFVFFFSPNSFSMSLLGGTKPHTAICQSKAGATAMWQELGSLTAWDFGGSEGWQHPSTSKKEEKLWLNQLYKEIWDGGMLCGLHP